MTDNDDWVEIQASLAGDEEAFTRLVRRYERTIAGQMWRFCRNAATCEELVQDVFVEAYFGLRNFRPQAPFEHWLRRIATRVGYRHWQKLSRQPRQTSLTEWDQADSASAAEKPSPEKALELLQNLLAQLPESDRLILALMYFEECPLAEIALRLKINVATAKMRVHRARQKLRTLVESKKLGEDWSWTD